MKNGFISKILSKKNHEYHLAKPASRLQGKIWKDQVGVILYYYELLKATVNTDRYRQQMLNLNCALINKRPQ